jgi:signal transduction histidine kinase
MLLGSTVLAQVASQLRFQMFLQSTLNILKRSAYSEQLSSQGVALYANLVYSAAEAGAHLNEDGLADQLIFSLCSGNEAIATVPVWQEDGELPCSMRSLSLLDWRWGEVLVDAVLPDSAPPLRLKFKVLTPWYGYPTLILNAIFFCLLSLIAGAVLKYRRERLHAETAFARSERRVHELRRDLSEAHLQRTALETEAGLGKLAAQVAHDIRSPLTVLQLLMEQFPNSDTRYRLLAANAVRRIQGIAGDIATNYRESARVRSPVSSPGREAIGHAILPLVEDIMTEKRLEAMVRPGVRIAPVMLADPKHLNEAFARVDAGTFKRVVSNLVNNAMEAVSKQNGHIRVSVGCAPDSVVTEIADDGPGIPEELVGRLGERGVSSGKHEGLGLGLHHARESVEAWGGRLEVFSKRGEGTRIRILLPTVEKPIWHVSRIAIAPGTHISIIDDDELVHGLWAERWSDLHRRDPSIKVEHYLTLDRFSKSERTRGRELLLMDNEFLGAGKTGLDFIEDRGLFASAILVTGAYDESGIISRCTLLGVGLLPKPLISRVQLELSGPDLTGNSNSYYFQN